VICAVVTIGAAEIAARADKYPVDIGESPVNITGVTDQPSIDRITGEFRKDLKSLGSDATVVRCTRVVNYVQQMPSGHDSSFGATCEVLDGGLKKIWTMCDDWMIGKFHATDRPISTMKDIGDFIYAACPPGG
jgi:hypothetical protein